MRNSYTVDHARLGLDPLTVAIVDYCLYGKKLDSCLVDLGDSPMLVHESELKYIGMYRLVRVQSDNKDLTYCSVKASPLFAVYRYKGKMVVCDDDGAALTDWLL